MIVNRGHDFGKARVSRAFPHAVDTRVNATCAGTNGRQTIGRRKAVVVVTVKLEVDFGPRPYHEVDVSRDTFR